MNLSRRDKKRHPFYWVLLLIAAVALSIYGYAGLMIYHYGSIKKDYGWQYDFDRASWYITNVDQQSPAAGKLMVGDKILAIDGDDRIRQPITGDLNYIERYEPIQIQLRAIAPQTPYSILIERHGQQRLFEMRAQLTRNYKNLGAIFLVLAISLFVCAMAIFIGWSRPEQHTARLVCIGLTVLAIVQVVDSLRPINELLQGNQLLIYFLIFTAYPFNAILGFHFFYRFPAGIAEGRSWNIIKKFFYIFGALIALTRKWLQWHLLQGGPIAIPFILDHARFLRAFWWIHTTFELLVFTGVIMVMARNFGLAQAIDQRRRIRWVIYGAAAGMLPWGLGRLIIVLSTALGYSGNFFKETSGYILNFAIILIPIALTYSIVKHRVFDVTVVIRRSLQYMLAKNFLRAIIWLPVMTIGYEIINNPHQPIDQLILGSPFSFALFVAAAISLKFRGSIKTWVDHRFFREAYNQEQILLGLLDEIKNLDSLSQIARLVSEKLNSALHPRGIFLFYQEGSKRELKPGYSTSELLREEISVSEDSPLFQIMEREDLPREIDLDDERLTQVELEWIRLLGINLVVPMKGSDRRLLGLLMLGEKRSEKPYSAPDCQLLQAIAGHMALAYEMNRLKDRIDKEEKIKQEVLAHFEDQKFNLVKECPECGACYDSAETICQQDKIALTLSLPVERVIDEKYRLDRLLGKGGSGAVYEAVDLRLNRKVAVKILVGNLFGDQSALRRFEREARTSARLNHNNIIAIHDYGRLNKEGAYLVMELLKGETMRMALHKRKALDATTAACWFDQIFEGLKVAHQAGVIHRDLKPENIFIGEQENGEQVIKILDFGIAKVKYPDANTLNSITTPGTIIGTLGYMSPEQLTGEEVDERTDLFAIGVMIVEALTGNRPFTGKSLPELITSMLREPFHLKGKEPAAQNLDLLLQKCLGRRASERFSAIAEAQKLIIPAIREYPIAPQPASSLSNQFNVSTEVNEATTKISQPGKDRSKTISIKGTQKD